jgi:hypothetical protein
MPRSSAQSDFSVSRPAEIELPEAAGPVSLPMAPSSSEAGALATRWVLRATVLLLLALAVLCAVGPHLPSGE